MNLGTSIRKNTAWIFTSSLIGRAIQFIVGIALARILVPEDFGLLVTIQIFTGAAGFIAGGGMGQALIQAKEADKRHFHVVFTLQFLICSLIYSFFFLISPWFATWFGVPIYSDLLRISALSFLIRPFKNVPAAKLKREMRFKALSINGLVSLTIGSSISIFLALQGYGVWSLVYGGISSASYGAISLTLISKCYPSFYYENSIAKTLGSYGFKFSINNIIEYLRTQTPNFLMGRFIGPQIVGLFNKGNSLSSLPVQVISGSAYQTVFRVLSSTQDNIDKCKYIYLRTITLVSIYTFPFYIGLFWLSESFIVTVYGDKWRLAAIPLQILAVGKMFSCITNPSGAVMAAKNRLGIEIILQLLTLLLVIIGCWYGITKNSLTQISLGILPSFIFTSISMSFFALHTVKANYIDLFIALRPAFLLNGLLALALYSSDKLFYHYHYEFANSDLAYLMIQSINGCLFYIIIFLYLPIKALEKEASRWKKKLRIPHSCPQS